MLETISIYDEEIEKYFDGELSEDETIKFESVLKNNAELQSDFYFRKKVNDALQQKYIIRLRKVLEYLARSE